ncbi:hypothetical protein Bca52824_006298 [Brassica carinata]|uniref:Uncharacterized protein n=1 Tax=Brassica carinata TaxID=52824 RepID=A0A8X7WQD3_BRACI|nr:hypothetical protein Bca52824_006298 [Brassica carinata]
MLGRYRLASTGPLFALILRRFSLKIKQMRAVLCLQYNKACSLMKHFVVIVMGFELDQVPCRSGMCMSPIHATSSQLISSEIFLVPMIKALLYSGAIVNGLATNMTFPKRDNVLDIYNLTNVKDASAVPDLHLVLAGSYFSVAGAFVGFLKPGRMSMFGSLLLVWGLVKVRILKKPMSNTDPSRTVYVYPTMVIAMICAFSMINYNLKKATRPAPTRPVAKPLMSSSKSKLK